MQGRSLLDRFLNDDSGQDLIEYGLLASIIAVAGILVFPRVGNVMGAHFSTWGTAVYNLWEPGNPAAAAP